MAGWDDVRRAASALPGVTEEQGRSGASWRVRGTGFVWHRPLRRYERAELGDAAPADDVILGMHVEDLGVKEALLAEDGGAYFTTSHFDGYPAILVRLDRVDVEELRELVTDAWRLKAPKRLVAELDG